MSRYARALIVSAVMALYFCQAHANPIMLFDNGAPLSSDTVLRRNGMSGLSTTLTIYDDFSLKAGAVISDIVWYQLNHRSVEELGLYQGTTISVWAGQPAVGELLIEFTAQAVFARDSRFSYAADPDQTNWWGYEFSISGLDLSLAAGSYWLGIHNNDSGANDSNWAMTSVQNDLAGRWQRVEDYGCGDGTQLCYESLNFIESEDSAFSVSGFYVSVPEPGTIALLGIGLLGMGLARNRNAWTA